MARVLDDIVHYFKGQGIDIIYTDNVYLHCLDHYDRVQSALSRRAYPEADLIRAVVEAEQHVQFLEEQVRELWATKRTLVEQLTAKPQKHPELYEEDAQ